MKSIDPGTIEASRVYFTEFDRITYSQVAWSDADVEHIKLTLERKLKLLALVKGHVVIAASHLIESELAHEVLMAHPRLFGEGLIVPALRSEFSTLEDFVQSKISEGREADLYEGGTRLEMARMIDASARWAVPWDMRATSAWFKTRILRDLEDPRSVPRLSGVHELAPWQGVIDRIRDTPSLSRKDVYRFARDSGDKRLWDTVCTWADFVYYLSGAVAVRSEGVLPQENLLDFSVTDMAGGRTRLSEMQVFFKLFVDLVKQATQAHFPVDTLDALSLEDALDLHAVALSGRFIEKYNLIQERTRDGLDATDPERLVLLMEELEQFEGELHDEYQDAIQRELPAYQKAIKSRDVHRIASATASLVVPYYDLPKTIGEMIVSGLNLSGRKKWAERFERRIHGNLSAIDVLMERRDLAVAPVLLKFVDAIKKRYSERLYAA